MFELKNRYGDITFRFRIFCQMWYLGYHGFKAIIQLSTGRNGMRTFNMIEFIPIVFRQVKAFHQAAVSSRFEIGSSFDTFIQYLGSKSGWKPCTTCQGTP